MVDSPHEPNFDPETLERLRRSVPVRIDTSGRTWIGDDPVTHPRVDRAIRTGIDITEDGEFRMVFGPQWCYLKADDCPLRVTAVARIEDGLPILRLDDGREIPLDPSTLRDDGERGLRCSVPSRHSDRSLPARFTNVAQMDLAPMLEALDDGWSLVIAGRSWPILSGRNLPIHAEASDRAGRGQVKA